MRTRISGIFSRTTNFTSRVIRRNRFTESNHEFSASLDEFFPEAKQPYFWVKAAAWTAASVALYVGYKAIAEDKRLNRVLDTRPEMQEFEESLKEAFAHANNNDVVACSQFNGLLDVIAQNNKKLATQHLRNLRKLNAKLTPRIRDNLIVYTANHGKIYILEVLASIFGEDIVRRNKMADELFKNLTHTTRSTEFKQQLQTKFSSEFKRDKYATGKLHSLLNAIELGDPAYCDMLINELHEHGTKLTDNIRNDLVTFAAYLGKVAVLEHFVAHLGKNAICTNSVARELLRSNSPSIILEQQRKLEEKYNKHFSSRNHAKTPSGFSEMLEAIKRDKAKAVKNFYGNLRKQDIRLPANISDDLIEFAASQASIEVLKCLSHILGPDTVRNCDVAKELLNFAESKKERFERFAEQYYQSPSKIRYDGAVAYIEVMQPEILRQNIQYRVTPPVFTFDHEGDTIAIMTYLRQVQTITDEMEEKFRTTTVIDTYNGADAAEEFIAFSNKMIDHNKKTGKTVVPTYVFTGGHYSVAQAKLTFHDNNSPNAHVIYIDPKGVCSSVNTCDFRYFTDALTDAFGEDTILHISEERLQYAGAGCSLFALHHWEELMNFDTVFAANTQYDFAGMPYAIFDYAKHHQAGIYPYPVHLARGVEDDDTDYDYFKEIKHFHTFVLPLSLSIQKQSFNADGTINDMPDVFSKENDGTYRYELGDSRTIVMLGAMGIRHSLLFSPRQRAQEQNKPATLQGDKTANDLIQEGTETHAGLKERNALNRNWAYEAGNRMTRLVRNFN